MGKIGSICLGAGLLCGFFAANAATVYAQPNDIWVYIDGQYYQCAANANGTTSQYEARTCKNAVDSYKVGLKTCMDYYANSRLSSFSEDCIRPITKDFKTNSKQECFFEAKVACMPICLEKYKNSRLIGYQDCDAYCSEQMAE